MKKFLIIISAAVMSMCFTACAGNDNTNVGSQSTESVQTSLSSVTAENESSAEAVQTSLSSETDESESITEILQTSSSEITDVESSTESSEISAPSETAAKTESETSAETANSPEISASETSSDEGGKILVAYFSATGNTEGIAQKLADGLGADLYEITPTEPYTDEDLDYGNSGSRSSVEMNDPGARPAISGSVENMEQYDVVLIGYPIWWGEAPRIMSTFIESYDFSGKTLAAFCTSASSGFGNSDSALRVAASGATWLKGQRFSAGASADDVMEWANGLAIN